MDIKIFNLDVIEDKEIYAVDPSEEVNDEDTLRTHRKLLGKNRTCIFRIGI